MTFLWSLNGGQKFKFSPTFGRIQNSEFYTQRNVVQNVTFFIRIINPILVRLKHRNSPRVRHPVSMGRSGSLICVPPTLTTSLRLPSNVFRTTIIDPVPTLRRPPIICAAGCTLRPGTPLYGSAPQRQFPPPIQDRHIHTMPSASSSCNPYCRCSESQL